MLRHSYFPSDVGSRRHAAVLIAAGYEVDVVCLREKGQAATENVNGVKVYRLPLSHIRGSKARYFFQYAASLLLCATFAAGLHLRRRYDAIQVYTMPDLLAFATALPKLLGARVVLDVQDLMPELYRAQYGVTAEHAIVRLLELQEGAAMRLADRIFTVTEEFRQVLVTRHGRQDVDVIMNCPDDTLFPRRVPSIRQRRSNGHRDGFVLASHGVILERLGYDTIVKAAALLRGAIPELQVRFAGSGEYARDLVWLAERLGIADRVLMLGHLPLEQIPAFIASADLGVVANRKDGFADLLLPTKLLEYVWMGLPVVVSRTQTIERYFDENMVTFFIPGDERDLARRILDLYNNPQRRLEQAANAARFFDRYNWPAEQGRYKQIIGSLLSRNGPSTAPVGTWSDGFNQGED